MKCSVIWFPCVIPDSQVEDGKQRIRHRCRTGNETASSEDRPGLPFYIHSLFYTLLRLDSFLMKVLEV